MKLSLGLSDSARTRPLATGAVPIEGVEPEVTLTGVQALFNQQMAEHTYDVCEFPLATYLRSLENPARPYLAVPVFPSRHFRLSCLFVHEHSGVKTPADLAGRRVGVAVFDMAAAVWLRGILQDFHGLDRFAPTYVIGGFEGPRTGDEHPQYYPPGFTFEHRADAGLAQLLAAGEIDAVVTARAPSTWPGPSVRRLFGNVREAELAYWDATGIFPAMHVLAVKRPIAEAHPELPGALFRAFGAAQAAARAALFESASLETVLPWQLEELLETEARLGAGYWATGLAENRVMLEKMIDYCAADGLVTTAFTPDDLFAGPGDAEILAS
jgi:4,5-dihydroxyphthalate decarboxylase